MHFDLIKTGDIVQHYSISGLAVSSEIELPGLAAIAAGGEHAIDVTIRQQPVPVALEGAEVTSATWQLDANRFLLRVPGIARFLLSGGREIRFEAEPGADPADIPVFILGTAFGILLHQRQQVVLHASAVQVNGLAVLFCGASGAGKSTIAAALAQRGFPLVTDDVCAISIGGSAGPIVHSDGRQLKLWAQAIEHLDLSADRGEPVRAKLKKFYVKPGQFAVEPLRLGAIYALRESRPPHATGIERPNVVDAALILRRNAYRPLLVRRMGQKANYFHAATTMANHAGIFHLTRELNFAAMPDTIERLERHWIELGLTEKAA